MIQKLIIMIMKMIKLYNKTMSQSLVLTIVLTGMLLLSGCSDAFDEFTGSKNRLVSRELILIEPAIQSRGMISEFPDGAELQVKFYAEKWYSWSKATYSAIENKWTIEFPEEILESQSGICKVVYADTGDYTASDVLQKIDINGNTSLMMDEEGMWNTHGNVIVVTALLKPTFSRIRFSSESPVDVWVKGFGMPYAYFGASSSPAISSTYLESAPCYPKFISVKQKGDDGKFYSDYYYTHTSKCEFFHTSASTWASSWEYLDCPENLKLSIYFPSETAYYYYKKLPEFKAGESYLVNLPTTSNYSGWTRNNNVIKTISSEIKIGDGSNTSQRYSWSAESVIYGKCVNFTLSSNGGDGYVYISNTNFNYRPIGSYTGREFSAIYTADYGYGSMTFGFNVSSITKYYTKFENIRLSHFPLYDMPITE